MTNERSWQRAPSPQPSPRYAFSGQAVPSAPSRVCLGSTANRRLVHSRGDRPGSGTHWQETSDIGDDVAPALAAARRDASQYLEAPLPRFGLVPAGQFPCNHRGPQLSFRPIIGRLGRRLVQARQDRSPTLPYPLPNRNVSRLSPLRGQETVEP